MNTGVLADSFRSIKYYLTPAQKREGGWMFVLLLISSLLDVFGLASLIPLIMAASEPTYLSSNKYLFAIYNALGFVSERNFLLSLITALFIFFLFKNLFTTWINYRQVKFAARVAVNIIESQFEKYSNIPFWNFNSIGSANLMHSTLNIPQAFVGAIIRPLFIVLSEIIIIGVILVGIFVFMPVLLVILGVVLGPATFFTYRLLRNKSQKLGYRINQLRPVSYSISADSFSGFVELKLANKRDDFKRKLLENQDEFQALEAKAYLFSLVPLKIIEMVAILGVLTIFVYSLLFSDNPRELITIVGLFAAAAYRLMPSVNRLLVALVDIKRNQYTIEDLVLYRDITSNPDVPQVPLVFERTIQFQEVSFAFPGADKPTLNNISFTVKKGEKIGFVGSSGSGKTTLMNVLLRFYEEQQGQVLVDGVPLTANNLNAWHAIIGYVKQDTFLMEASIKDNITLGDKIVDPKRLDYALEQASLKNFVESLPEGVNTFIGERGSKLSGGQRQRIGIARAMYKNTEILILDEATSALDNETEREVNEAINKLSQTDITILIIAHRITTLRECDRIYELANGEIISEHKYEDLIKAVI